MRGNHSPFMNRELWKAIMTRTRLRNKFCKEKTVENRKNYNKQRSYCVALLRKVKKEYYDSLDEKRVTDNKIAWKSVKPFRSDKTVNSPKIRLVEKNETINNEEKIAEIFNTYFTNIVSNFTIPLYQDTDFAGGIDPFVGDDPITFILEKYKNYPSIIAIKNFCRENKTFNFETIKRDNVLKKIKSLDRSKTSQNGDVSTKIIKENAELFTDLIPSALNEAIQSGNFPSCLKWADVTTIFKKGFKISS